MHNVRILFLLLIFLVWTASADSELSDDSSRTFESINELTRELNQQATSASRNRMQTSRQYDPEIAHNGKQLYHRHCSRCHGENAQGDPNWHRRDDSGNFPPPPLDGTAHTWHHPKAQLVEIIQNGSNIMPSFKLVLSAKEIGYIIYWFQTFWPDDLYQVWATQNAAFEKDN